MTHNTIIGVGCAGGYMVDLMIKTGLRGADFVAVNTDREKIETSLAPVKFTIGERLTHGYGPGLPHIGAQAAEEAADTIAGLCDRTKQIIIVAGMGGGTGTGASPVIARIAQQQGCRTLAIVTEPFPFEGKAWGRRGEAGLQALKVDLLVTVPTQDLLDVLKKAVTLRVAFHLAATLVCATVAHLPALLTTPGPEHREVVDVRAMLALAGVEYSAG